MDDIQKIIGIVKNTKTSDSHGDEDIKKKSEESYIEITKKIVDISKDKLDKFQEDKEKARKPFITFFKVLLAFQILILSLLLFFNGFNLMKLSDGIIITFITSVFLETLGVVTIMVTFTFNNDQETEIIKVLNQIVSNFQKYNNKN